MTKPFLLSLFSLLFASGALCQEFRGELTDDDKKHKQSEGRVDYHIIRAQAGKFLEVTMTAGNDDLDTVLHIVGPSGQEYSNDDDDESGGTDSRLAFRVPESGEWEIAATGFEEDRGPYVVKAQQYDLTVVLAERGDLEEGDDVTLKTNEYYDKFMINVEAGKKYVAMAASSDFDSFLAVHYPGGFKSNDDAEGADNMSLVEFNPAESGKATIVMTLDGYGRVEGGRYRLACYEAVAQPSPK